MLDEFFNYINVYVGISIWNGCIYVHKEVKLGNKIIWAVDPLLSPKRPLVIYCVCRKVWEKHINVIVSSLIQQLDTYIP